MSFANVIGKALFYVMTSNPQLHSAYTKVAFSP